MRRLTCDTLLLLAEDGLLKSVLGKEAHEWMKSEDLALMKGQSQFFEVKPVPGNHHVHLNHPERIGPPLQEFLLAEPSIRSHL